MEERYFLLRQENIYWGRDNVDNKWYRRLFGGTWYYIKIGKDTPYIGMFATWTKMDRTHWSGYIEILDTETYKITNADTRWKLFKELVKNIFRIK